MAKLPHNFWIRVEHPPPSTPPIKQYPSYFYLGLVPLEVHEPIQSNIIKRKSSLISTVHKTITNLGALVDKQNGINRV